MNPDQPGRDRDRHDRADRDRADRDRADRDRAGRDRDADGRARQARPRDRLGRPLPYGSPGVEPVPETALPPTETLRRAAELLREGRPFSAHEVCEARWKDGPEAERDLWQGLAQACVGLTHAERGNAVGAARLLGRARGRLEAYATGDANRYGLDLAGLIGWLGRPDPTPEELADRLLGAGPGTPA